MPLRPDADTLHTLAAELIAMAAEDQRVRAELLAEGVLFDGYQPRMAEVHHRNAVRLATIMSELGWPRRSLVGRTGADAAWAVCTVGAVSDAPPGAERVAPVAASAGDATSTAATTAAAAALARGRSMCQR